MCTGLEPALLANIAAGAAIAGTAVSVYSGIQQGKQADAMANQQEQQAKDDAAFAASEAQVQARTIRKAADKQRAEARTALAGSGVVVGEGTAEQIDSEIQTDSESDALMAIYDGNNRSRSIIQSGNLAATQSRNSASASRTGAFSSALQGGSVALKGWNTSKKT